MRSPLRYVIKDGKHADCWQVGGTNHGCFLRFDLGGTPRITQVKTAVLQASAFMRIGGSGIDGGLLGAPLAGAKLHREYLTKGPGSIKGGKSDECIGITHRVRAGRSQHSEGDDNQGRIATSCQNDRRHGGRSRA